jgi:hypothetical protein
LTNALEIKHRMASEGRELDTPFDWDATYAKVCQWCIERDRDPDKPY